jgi:septal ring factor EnvC (AmiA/AmiB activator)
MAKQAQPAPVEPAATEPAADPQLSVADFLAARDLRIEEIEAQNLSLERSVADKDAKLADVQAQLAAKDGALAELAAKLADARESLAKAEEAHARSLERVEREPGRTGKFVARIKIRAPIGWVSPGEAFDATEAELEGYELGVHFDLKD